MDSEVAEVIPPDYLKFWVLGPCRDPEPRVSIHPRRSTYQQRRETDFVDDWFMEVSTETVIGVPGRVVVVKGEHHCREDFNYTCVRDLITGEHFDFRAIILDSLTDYSGDPAFLPWRILYTSEEVLAWLAD